MISSLRHTLARFRKVAARFVSDGRIPRSTWRLYSDYWRFSFRERIKMVLGALLPPVGGPKGAHHRRVRSAPAARRWYAMAGPPFPAFELLHDNARSFVDALTEVDVRPFLIDGDDRSLQFGLPEESRRQAISTLKSLSDGPWYISWVRGARDHVSLLQHAPENLLARAESWRLFRVMATGTNQAIGRGQGVAVSFWAVGEEGQRERLGYRGLHRFDPNYAAPVSENLGGHELPGLTPFPVGNAIGRFDAPVDFVYTWVDDQDPIWQAEFSKWTHEAEDKSEDAIHHSRFRSLDELRYSLRSVWLYAGWFNHIYVVTSGQIPTWLADHPRLTVVPHSEIMPAESLPTFNSQAIEASLHRIPGLSEHFIYMNDDFFLARPVGRDTFFTSDGRLKYVESEALIPLVESTDAPAVEQSALNNRKAVEEAFGRSVVRRLDHAPHALLKSVMEHTVALFPNQIAETVSHRFRHPRDLSLASGLTQFVAACTGHGMASDLVNRYMNVENPRLEMFLQVIELDERVESFCLNQTHTQFLSSDADQVVKAFLERFIAVPAPWEKKQ